MTHPRPSGPPAATWNRASSTAWGRTASTCGTPPWGCSPSTRQGRYTSGDRELDQYLTDIVLEVSDPQAAPKENLEAVYRYVCDNAGYRGADMIPEGSSQWEEKAALTAFQAGNMGNCYSYAAMVTMLARKLGFQASAISGEFYTDLNGSTVVHGWCEIQEGDQLYLCDAEVESVYAANRDLSWDLFYQPYGATPTRYFVFGEEKL